MRAAQPAWFEAALAACKAALQDRQPKLPAAQGLAANPAASSDHAWLSQ